MKLTKEQAAIIGVYTGCTCGPFEDIHKKIEDVLERPVCSHEMADKNLMEHVRSMIRDEFLEICADKEKS